MNNELKATLLQAFALGYIEQMAGREVTDDDKIDSETASEIEAAALAHINKVEAKGIENPPPHNEMYQAGRAAYQQAATLWMQRN